MLQRLRQSADPDFLLKQLCFHGIEGFDVGFFPDGCLFAGKPHAKEAEPIAGHFVVWKLLASILIFKSLKIEGLKFW